MGIPRSMSSGSKSTPIKTGGLAFPSGNATGMTLRDYFAAKALQALLTNVPESTYQVDSAGPIAAAAYGLADLMLEARQERK